jgi:beta-glucosidase
MLAPSMDPADPPISALPLARKVELLSGRDNWSLHPAPELGLDAIFMADGPNGVRFGSPFDERNPAPVVPSAGALAATWRPALVERIGTLLGESARGFGVHVLLAPTVNLHRTPLAGRNFECYSEDPLLSGTMAAAFVRGVQSTGVAATVKHLVCNEAETNRQSGSSELAERTLRELYLRPFELAVEGALPWAVMTAYNRTRGTFMAEHPLVDDLLRRELGFDGLVVSDWAGVKSTVATAHAGLDIEMPGPPRYWGPALLAAVEAGEVAEEELDVKLRRLLQLAERTGALEGTAATGRQPEGAALIREAAAESFVLLRNESGLLPLEGVRRIALLGPLAEWPEIQAGGAANVFPERAVSPLEGLRRALPDGVELVHEGGYAPAILPRLDLRWVAGGAFTVDYLDRATGAVLATEERRTDRFLISGTPAGLPSDAVDIRLRGTLVPPLDGTYRLGVNATGATTVRVGGEEVLALPPEHDVDHFRIFAGDVRGAVDLALAAGEHVPFELVLRGQKGGRLNQAGLISLRCAAPAPADALERAVAAARDADVAIVVVGLGEALECEGFDRETLALPDEQLRLVEAVAAAQPRTVAVVNAGAPILLDWAERIPALLWAWYPGQEYGDALADVLLGAAEPGGRLPTTLGRRGEDYSVLDPRPDQANEWHYDEGLLIGYRHFDRRGIEPAYPFGHGLGYTDWAYDGLEIEAVKAGAIVRVRLRNTGGRRGKEVVQAYVAPVDTDATRPVRELRAFAAVDLDPGEERTVELRLDWRAFCGWDETAASWTRLPGPFEVAVGRSSRDLRLTATLDR